MNNINQLSLVLGNQLFPIEHYSRFPQQFFMAEDKGLCTHFRYHKHKIIHFLASMRTYAQALRKKGAYVEYFDFDSDNIFLDCLAGYIKENNVKEVHFFEIEDKFFEKAVIDRLRKLEVKACEYQSPMFLCSRKELDEFFGRYKRPLMNNFYIEQRKKRNILMNGQLPVGGHWHFDQENRKKIPKKMEVSSYLPKVQTKDPIVENVKALVEKHFPDHPGSVDNFWIPVDRKNALKEFSAFLKNRLEKFGTYQDALDQRNPFLYHSLISPSMNIGHLTPDEIIKEVEALQDEVNISCVEGLIRQIMGWREFLRGVYQRYDHIQQKKNFFDHQFKLTNHWYNGTTGIEPLDDVIKKTQTWGYAHHIERLMVVGNLMLLLEVHPQEAYRWFMEMFVDSSDWVMGPNVFGMSQFSDGGIFATKPYISGSNYIFKMGHYKKGEKWADAWDGLYWRFIHRKRDFLSKNHRLNMMVSMLDKMPEEKKVRIFKAAEELQRRITR